MPTCDEQVGGLHEQVHQEGGLHELVHLEGGVHEQVHQEVEVHEHVQVHQGRKILAVKAKKKVMETVGIMFVDQTVMGELAKQLQKEENEIAEMVGVLVPTKRVYSPIGMKEVLNS